MIFYLLKLEWKQFFRSPSFQKSIIVKILMGLFALYLIAVFLGLSTIGFFILKKKFPGSDPFQIVNSYLIFVVIGDLICKYLMQKLPIINIKPFLVLPLKKSKLIHHVLLKSSFSFFNIFWLFLYIPFSVILLTKGYNKIGVIAWLIAMLLIIQTVNFLNFLINKNNKVLAIIVSILLTLIGLQNFEIIEITSIGGSIFKAFYRQPLFILFVAIILVVLYLVNYKLLRKQVYLDEAIDTTENIVSINNLSFVDKLGDVAPFIKNDIRLIWRNKRTKTVFLMSFLFLFYGLIFFTQKKYLKMPPMLMFASLFVTGGFTLNYGQFIPAWDSAHYKMLMTQGFKYRKFLESKWILMVIVTTVLYLCSFPYLYFGTDIFLIITAGAIFNIGFNSLFILYSGAYNRKKIDLTQGGFSNTQGISATQFIIIIPLMLFPMLLFWLFNKFIGYNSGFIMVTLVGVVSLLFKNYAMNLIEKKYIKSKYAMINAFEK